MMFKKTQIVLLTILLPLATFANSAASFCQNPVSQICTTEKKGALHDMRVSLYREAVAVAVKSYPTLALDQDKLNTSQISADQVEAAQSLVSSELLKAFENQLKKQDLIITNADLLPMKKDVGTYAAKYYNDLNNKDLITSINVISTKSQYAQFVETLPAEIKSIESVSTFYDRFCGDLQTQAHFEKSQNFVLVCPGIILKAMANTGKTKKINKLELISRLTFVLSHEMSHSLDMNITMGTFYSCLQKNHSQKKEEAEFDFGKRTEVYADYFGFIQLSKELNKLKTTSEKIELTRQNLQGLCDSDTSVDHPSKGFRIGVLLNYPSVSSQLGCATKVENQCQ